MPREHSRDRKEERGCSEGSRLLRARAHGASGGRTSGPGTVGRCTARSWRGHALLRSGARSRVTPRRLSSRVLLPFQPPARPASPERAGLLPRAGGAAVTPTKWLVAGSRPPQGHSTSGRGPKLSRLLSQTLLPPEKKRKRRRKEEREGRQTPHVLGPPSGWEWGQQQAGRRLRPSLGGRCGAGLLLPGHGDGPLAVAAIHAGRHLGASEGQHAVGGQGAGEGRLVHVGRQAVAAVELAGDVAVVVLRGAGGGTVRDADPRGEGPPPSTRVPPTDAPPGWAARAGLGSR